MTYSRTEEIAHMLFHMRNDVERLNRDDMARWAAAWENPYFLAPPPSERVSTAERRRREQWLFLMRDARAIIQDRRVNEFLEEYDRVITEREAFWGAFRARNATKVKQ